MRNGQQIDVDAMDENHLRNTLKMIIRNINAQVKKENKFKLRGEIAQDHVAQMEDAEYYDECADNFEQFKIK